MNAARRRIVASAVAVIGTAAAAVLVTRRPAVPADAEPGTYAASVATVPVAPPFELTLHDPKRGKDVPVYAVVPAGAGPWPTIVLSHGNDSGGGEMRFLFAFWASRGYACLAPTHDDAVSLRRAAIDAGEDPPAVGVVAPVGAGVASVLNRAADLSFVIDSLGEIGARTHTALDPARVGVGGVSFGAYTALLLGGVTAEMDGEPRSAPDPRPRAFLVMAGLGTGQGGLTPDSWRPLARPLLNVVGNQDDVPRNGTTARKHDPFALAPAGDKFDVTIPDANHGTFRCDPAATFYAKMPAGDPPHQRAAFTVVRDVTLAFWDAYLKGDRRARDYLRSDALARRWPGVMVRTR